MLLRRLVPPPSSADGHERSDETLDLGCVQLFEKYDLDGSGCIDREELGKAIRDSLHLNIRETEIDVIMSEIDRDGGGDVDVDEFSAWLFAPSSEPWLDKKRRYPDDLSTTEKR